MARETRTRDELVAFWNRLARRAGESPTLRRVLEELARDEEEYRRRGPTERTTKGNHR